jgi:hypothetical protein
MLPFRVILISLAITPLLSACVSSGRGPIIVPDGAASRPAPSAQTTRAPAQLMGRAGLEGVIGAGEAQLRRQFGDPQLEVSEGDARKLQFAGEACVLDVFLYPERPDATPTATHVEARRASDGRDVDRAACARALRRR